MDVRIFHMTVEEIDGDGPPIGWILFFTMWEQMCRRQYAVERQNRDQFDLGGEA